MYKLIIDDEFLRVYLTLEEGRLFFHSEVKKPLTLSKVKWARKEFVRIKKEVLEMGYERLYAITPSPHFADLLGPGYVFVDNKVLDDGTYVEAILWELR